MQTTLRREFSLVGTGLHSGRPARLTVRPAIAEHGIWFKRVDVRDRDPLVPAAWDAVSDTTLNTRIANASGVTVSTIEHLMAALSGCGVSNALIEIDGPEVPIMDGSARVFVEAIRATGLRSLSVARRVIRVRKTVEVEQGNARAILAPADRLEIDFEIDFSDAAIGHQHKTLSMVNGTFAEQLSDSRTFCRQEEVDMMRSRGLALGGTLDNAIVVEDGRVLNPEGFRHEDECVRHKMLDAVGDLALAGAPIIGRYTGIRAGHGLTNKLLRKLFLTDGAIEFVTAAEGAPYLQGFHMPALSVAV
ncbi:UDP-3-O-acyl-N-acetylglucosamine deacetylase [Paroceanicella profunda]|uniref:UDP-3-O-acyl-N-acetylglucosamine deacetylase n=1 Tax=Paroceanicella profunda TaxID=2579971 RepID=A0A5B8FFZ6_9RHOB|nr:UDP-3-O-acyl-N-acetylglucosamine deacetylase [Paroceanicella profunda]QDL90497.1 UDP-3-O-acyl-N-acetylglucosamine deacetylase [Paroceanicella profunda]